MLGTGRWINYGNWRVWVWSDIQMRGNGKYKWFDPPIRELSNPVEQCELGDMTQAEYLSEARDIIRSGWIKHNAFEVLAT